MLQWTNQIRCTKRIIYNEGDTVLMCHSGHTFEVEHVAVWVTECLSINHLGVGLDGCIQSLKVIYINNRICDALSAERMGNQVV